MEGSEVDVKAPKSSIVAESDSKNPSPPDLRILHFNDVYHIEPGSRDPVGGIARFQTLHSYYRTSEDFANQAELLTFFSGDAFNPSLESTVTKGGHMVPFLNNLSIATACLGNHDLDFGVLQFQHLTSKCSFPWLLANVFELSGRVLGDCQPTHLLTSSNGIKIGLIGIAEEEWLATVNALPPDLTFVSASKTVNKYSPQLRSQGADMIIVLAHQREVNDNRLAAEAHDLDLILGGHDHQYRWSKIAGTHVLCSGTDFRQMSYIEARRRPKQPSDTTQGPTGWDFTITRRDISSSLPEDPEATELVSRLSSGLSAKLDKPIGYTASPLDARFTTVRKRESNLGNLVADILRNYYDGDCALVVGGTFRGDQVYPPGVLKIRDVMDCFPFEDPTVVVRVSGKRIRGALENSVSTWPALEGRFPQVSNIRFSFDPKKSLRIQEVHIGDLTLDEDKEYKLVTRHYTTQGGDGFSSLKTTSEEYIVNDENGQLISQLLRQYFMSLRVLGKWKRWSEHLGHHWGEVQKGVHEAHPHREPSRRDETQRKTRGEAEEKGEQELHHPGLSDSEDDEAHVPNRSPAGDRRQRQRELNIMRRVTRKWWRLAGITGHPGLCEEVGEEIGVHWAKGVCPRVEGRIRIIGEEE